MSESLSESRYRVPQAGIVYQAYGGRLHERYICYIPGIYNMFTYEIRCLLKHWHISMILHHFYITIILIIFPITKRKNSKFFFPL
jgi:hypothetical protein